MSASNELRIAGETPALPVPNAPALSTITPYGMPLIVRVTWMWTETPGFGKPSGFDRFVV